MGTGRGEVHHFAAPTAAQPVVVAGPRHEVAAAREQSAWSDADAAAAPGRQAHRILPCCSRKCRLPLSLSFLRVNRVTAFLAWECSEN